MLKVKCMYTKQLAKKRKTWSDGYLKITLSSRRCVLIDEGDYREIGLAARALEPIEMKKLECKEEFTMELAGVMVQIESGGYNFGPATSIAPAKEYQPPLKLAKFVPPSTIVPKLKPQVNSFQDRQYPSSSSSSNQYGVNPSRSYRVSNDELDDIWGGSSGGKGAAAAPDVDRVPPSEPTRIIPSVSRPTQPRRPPAEIDYESRYRPTPRPTIVNGSSSDELQRIIDSQWMKNGSESEATASVESAAKPDDGVWAPVIDNADALYEPPTSSTANKAGATTGGAKLLANGMTDFWADDVGGGSEGVFHPSVGDAEREGGHSVHYDVGYAAAALSDAVVNESIWSFD